MIYMIDFKFIYMYFIHIYMHLCIFVLNKTFFLLMHCRLSLSYDIHYHSYVHSLFHFHIGYITFIYVVHFLHMHSCAVTLWFTYSFMHTYPLSTFHFNSYHIISFILFHRILVHHISLSFTSISLMFHSI